MEKRLNKQTCEGRNKANKQKLKFLGNDIMHTRTGQRTNNKPSCTSKIMCMQVLAQKNLKIQK